MLQRSDGACQTLQVGKLQSACSLGRTQHAAGAGGGGSVGCSKASGDGASLSPEAARRFAAQQEELARAREELARAREEMAALREAEQAAEQQSEPIQQCRRPWHVYALLVQHGITGCQTWSLVALI